MLFNNKKKRIILSLLKYFVNDTLLITDLHITICNGYIFLLFYWAEPALFTAFICSKQKYLVNITEDINRNLFSNVSRWIFYKCAMCSITYILCVK